MDVSGRGGRRATLSGRKRERPASLRAHRHTVRLVRYPVDVRACQGAFALDWCEYHRLVRQLNIRLAFHPRIVYRC
jgi:hypothetical protein